MSAAAGGLRQQFIDAMGRVACTVTVVTTDGAHGRGGLTVSAMASVAADGPAPTLLVCVNDDASAAPAILANGVFCVSVLRSDQTQVSDNFSGRGELDETRRFECATWVPMASGSPRLEHALVAFDCRLQHAERVGTHHVLIARVGEIFSGADGDALVYANRRYGSVTPAA